MAMPCGGYVILMSRVKDIRLKVIPSKIANDFIRKHHYSGKVMQNSNLHFGAFLDGVLHGAMSFGNPIDKRKVLGLVKTDNSGINEKWNEMLELNRMAFDDVLPKYSESRSISIAIKLIKIQAPHVKWILSFADGTQCGDGTIYRASGFVLTQIKKNTEISQLPDGKIVSQITYSKGKHILERQGRAGPPRGTKVLDGFQFRYIYFLDPTARDRLTVPIIPFSKIAEVGASMYLGKRILREKQAMARPRVQRRGSADLHAPI